MGRDYDNSKRARRAARTSVEILRSAERLLRDRSPGAVTLAEIAEEAGVSVQTVIRHHGGREGVLEAMGRRAGERIDAQRMAVEPGDVEGAVDNVLEHYENDGDLVLQILSEEAASEFAARAASEGRIFHRRWVERVFGPLLGDDDLEEKIDALVVATDIYTWRLLRRDLRRDLEDVRGVMLRLVRANLGETP